MNYKKLFMTYIHTVVDNSTMHLDLCILYNNLLLFLKYVQKSYKHFIKKKYCKFIVFGKIHVEFLLQGSSTIPHMISLRILFIGKPLLTELNILCS